MSNTIVRATCPSCGDVVLTTNDLGLHLGEGRSEYHFACPQCRQPVHHDVPAGIVHVLQAAGVRVLDPDPEPLGEDDLARFLADFEAPDCIDQLRHLGLSD